MVNPYSTEAQRVRNAQLLDQVRQMAMVPLADAFASILQELPEALLDHAGKAGPAQIDYLDAMREVRRKREPMMTRFRAHLANAWQSLEAGKPLSVEYKLAESDGEGDYDLISHQELEVRLAVRRLADALAHKWRPELTRLNRYTGLIAGGLKLDSDTLPFGPHHIGAAVYDAFGACTLMPNAHLALIAQCEAALLQSVGQLYAQLVSGLMRVARGDTETAAQPRRRRRIPTSRGRADAGAAEAAEAPDWIARFFGQWTEKTKAGGAHAHPARSEHQRSPQEVLPAALHLVLRRARQEQGFSSDADPADGKRFLSQRELLSVLSLMQSTPPGETLAASPVLAKQLAQRLKWEALAGAGRLGIDPGKVRLDPADEDAIDLIGMLFDAMLEQCHLRGRTRELLLRLPVLYVKVALLDRELFIRDHHPARRLLNLLADAAETCNADETAEAALLREIERAIERLTLDFSENLELFASVEQNFAAFYGQYRRRIEIAERRATEMHRAQERRQEARRTVAAELGARVGARALPPAFDEFLQRYWSPYAGMVVLRGEAGAADRAEALALVDGLLHELDMSRVLGAARPWLEPLRPALEKVFAGLGLAADASAAAADTLRDTLQATATASAELVAELPPVPSAVALAEAEAPAPQAWDEPVAPQGVDETTADYFARLPLGTWLDFVARDGSVQPGKLTWISPISARLMFVNRRGSRLCVASADELAAMAHLDRVRLHRQDDAFYSAMQGAIDRLQV